jgi:hypothetical protein
MMHSTHDGRQEMREELRDCPLGEIPLLAPELISLLRRADRRRAQFGGRVLGGTGSDLPSYADKIHDAISEAVLAPDDEIAGLLGGVLVPVRVKVQTPPAA